MKGQPFVWKEGELHFNKKEHVDKFNFELNIIIGGREMRKSSNFLKDFIIEAMENLDKFYKQCTKRFVWMRLNQDTIQEIKPTFLAGIPTWIQDVTLGNIETIKKNQKLAKVLEKHYLEVVGNQIYAISKENKEERISIGEFVAMSKFTQRSVQYENVYNVHYDEFINTGRKMFDEYTAMLLILDTFRLTDKAGKCKIYLSANAIKRSHPLLVRLGITELKEGYTFVHQDNYRRVLFLRYPENKELMKLRKKSIVHFLGSLGDGAYNKMAEGNDFWLDDITNVGDVDWRYQKPWLKVLYKKIEFYLYQDTYRDNVVISLKPHEKEKTVAFNKNDVTKESVKVDLDLKKKIQNLNYKDKLYFDRDVEIKYAFLSSLK